MTTKVILTQNVSKIGKKGDIVDVARGHARNFLVSKGFARMTTDKDAQIALRKKETIASEREEELARLKDVKERLFKKHIALTIPGNAKGTLYRAATLEDVTDALFSTYGIDIPVSCIRMETIKAAGSHVFKVVLKDQGEIPMRARVKAIE